MIISKETKFIIYGAGFRGITYCDRLRKLGHEVIGFIDKNHTSMEQISGLPVWGLESLDVDIEYDNMVILISVSNVFLHFEIARSLLGSGFKYIIFKDCMNDAENNEVIIRNGLFDKITSVMYEKKIEGLNIREVDEKTFQREYKKEVIIEKQEYVIMPVPAVLLFGMTNETYEEGVKYGNGKMKSIVPNRSLLYFTLSKELMKFFLHTVEKESYDKYLQLYFEIRADVSGCEYQAIDSIEAYNHLKDRYKIMQWMDLEYELNRDFFLYNPLEVKWNKMNYFNIEDGNNRASFLYSKGQNFIYCKISKRDYYHWISNPAIGKLEKLIDEGVELEYPIVHPSFYRKIYKSSPYIYSKMDRICSFLYESSILPEKINVLDMSCRNGFIAQHFWRMGSRVRAVTDSIEESEILLIVNELLGVTGMEIEYSVTNALEQMKQGEFDIAFVPNWLYHRQPDIVEKIIKFVELGVFVDLDETDQLTNNKSYRKLDLLNYEGRLVELGFIWSRQYDK